MMTRRLWILSFAAGAWVLFIVPAVVSVFTHKLLLARAAPVVIKQSPCPPSRAELGPGPADPGALARAARDGRQADRRQHLRGRSRHLRTVRNMRALSRSARIVPEIRDGKASGFRLYSVHPDGQFARLGFQNGDVIRSINGLTIYSPENALDVYARLKSTV